MPAAASISFSVLNTTSRNILAPNDAFLYHLAREKGGKQVGKRKNRKRKATSSPPHAVHPKKQDLVIPHQFKHKNTFPWLLLWGGESGFW